MDPAYYVAAGSLKARAYQLETLSNNLANSSTVGYKSERSFFQVFNKAVQSSRNLPLTRFVNDGTVLAQRGIDFSQGPIRSTGRSLDLALEGDAFFMIQTPQGPRATRDGRFQMGTDGLLSARDGSPVMGKNGSPLRIDPRGGKPSFALDGTLSQDGKVMGQLDIRAFENPGTMEREGANRYNPGALKAKPVRATVAAGHLEESTVDTSAAMVDMIRLNRLYEMSMKVASTLTNDLDARSITTIALGQ